jgi:hypothetical protein
VSLWWYSAWRTGGEDYLLGDDESRDAFSAAAAVLPFPRRRAAFASRDACTGINLSGGGQSFRPRPHHWELRAIERVAVLQLMVEMGLGRRVGPALFASPKRRQLSSANWEVCDSS